MTTLTFCLMKAVPGDPFQREQALPTEIHEGLRHHYGLQDSLWVQYGRYIIQLLTFDFGNSFVYKDRSVVQIIKNGFPTSALLGLEALAVAIPCGILLGVVAALKQTRWQDSLIAVIAVIGVSVPSFILATFLQYFLAIKLQIFPIARWGSFLHSVLPALSLAALPIAFIARMTRAKLIEELKQGYINTARAKGLTETRIVIYHALRNIITPIICYLGPLTANILTGSFIIEKVFSIPGLGYWFVTSVLNRDYPLIMGITVFYCAILLFATFVVDVFCLMIDPRVADSERQKRVSA